MTNNTLVPVSSLVANIYYYDASKDQHYKWRKVGETHNMTFRQINEMFNQHPNYKNWLCPSAEALEPLGLTQEYYDKLKDLYGKIRMGVLAYR